MRRQIKLTTRRELTAANSQRYQAADRNGKRLILDEFVKLTRYHRKHAIRLLTTEGCIHQGRQVGRRTYLEAVKEALIVLWEASDRICGKRLQSLTVAALEGIRRVSLRSLGHISQNRGEWRQDTLHSPGAVKTTLIVVSVSTGSPLSI